jgi:hypothetical protein
MPLAGVDLYIVCVPVARRGGGGGGGGERGAVWLLEGEGVFVSCTSQS